VCVLLHSCVPPFQAGRVYSLSVLAWGKLLLLVEQLAHRTHTQAVGVVAVSMVR
jgi:hypothetical protein